MSNLFKSKKLRTWGMIAATILALFWAGQIFLSGRAKAATTSSDGTVTSMNVAETVNASGSLNALLSANLTWNTGGVVDQVYAKAGDQVKAGDVLMKLKTSSVSSNIISAQADLANAQKDLEALLSSSSTDLAQAVIDLKDAQEAYDKAASYMKYLQTSQRVKQTETKIFIEETFGSWQYRYKNRYFVGPASEKMLTDAENDLALKKAELADAQRTYDSLNQGADAQDVAATQAKIDAAQATVDTMSIIAPFDGEVLYVASQPNDVVNTDTSALNMANLDNLSIETQIDESDIAKIKVGNPVTATLDAMPDLKLTGKVAAVDSLGQENSGLVQYTVRIDLDKVAEDVSLPLGATANVTIEVKPATSSLTVPITVIQNDSEGEYVLVLQADSSAKRVDVVSSTIVGDRVVVTGDLKEGDSLTTSQTVNAAPRGLFGRGN